MRKDFPFVSIVIPATRNGELIEKCFSSIFKLDYSPNKFEVIMISPNNGAVSSKTYPVKTIYVSDITPGAKRNMAVKESKGSIIALCDDDVTVHKDWLKNLVSNFEDPQVAIVGGPNYNPPDSDLKERCSGYIFSSFLGSASMSPRYGATSLEIREANEIDLTSCNMAVRKSIVEKFSFPEEIWPNEETLFCHKVKEHGYKLLYDPRAIVWHQRRPIFLPHAKQVFGYGRGRGQMMRMCPSSIKMIHLAPSIFVLSLITGGLLSMLNNFFFTLYLSAVMVYSAIVLFTSIRIALRERDFKALLLLPLAFFLHHCAYGLGVLKGMIFSQKVRSSK